MARVSRRRWWPRRSSALDCALARRLPGAPAQHPRPRSASRSASRRRPASAASLRIPSWLCPLLARTNHTAGERRTRCPPHFPPPFPRPFLPLPFALERSAAGSSALNSDCSIMWMPPESNLIKYTHCEFERCSGQRWPPMPPRPTHGAGVLGRVVSMRQKLYCHSPLVVDQLPNRLVQQGREVVPRFHPGFWVRGSVLATTTLTGAPMI